MRTTIKIITSILLFVNGAGALYGGWNLMMHPDGSSLQISADYLQYSPFSDYLVPGIILFTVNGLFSLAVLFLLLVNYQGLPVFVIAQGAVLTGWIIIQVLMVQSIYYLHVVMGLAGLVLLLCGRQLLRMKNINLP